MLNILAAADKVKHAQCDEASIDNRNRDIQPVRNRDSADFLTNAISRGIKDIMRSSAKDLMTGRRIGDCLTRSLHIHQRQNQVIACCDCTVNVDIGQLKDAVGNDSATEAPFVAQDSSEQISIFSSTDFTDTVEGGHDSACAAFLNGNLKGLDIDFTHCLLVHPSQ